MSKNIAKKIVDISAEIGKLEKDGYNQHSRFHFISFEQANARLRTLLHKHGLAIMPSVESFTEETFVTAKGGTAIRTTVTCKYTLICTDTGDKMEFISTGADNDNQGKSMGKAITEAQKRFEFKLFHISSAEDKDPDCESNSVKEKVSDITDRRNRFSKWFQKQLDDDGVDFLREAANYLGGNVTPETVSAGSFKDEQAAEFAKQWSEK